MFEENGLSSWVILACALAALYWGPMLWQRLQLSLAKHPSMAGHLRWAKRLANWAPAYDYPGEQWFRVDHAPEAVGMQRQQALQRLGSTLAQRSPKTLALTQATKPMVSDMQLISRYRVPFQFQKFLSDNLQIGSYWSGSKGVWVADADDQWHMDVTGSYGVNLFGADFYKSCMQEGMDLVRDLGPVLGAYHPCVQENVAMLCQIAHKDEVSFHMSGTEAVMQAVRLARYHTGKRKVVRFTGAYHGWWDDVQPGPGNPMPPSNDTLTLNEMHPQTLKVLRQRKDIACVLVNPLQAMHPNKAAPSDSTLIDGSRQVSYDKAAYAKWLGELRQVCDEKGIAFIMDEVFMGFRLGLGGAQAFFGVDADLVTYGKTLGGGFPVGVVCGKAAWMRRFREEKPGNICFARGTFNAHPGVMGAMNVFLKRVQGPAIQAVYQKMEGLWIDRMKQLNDQLLGQDLPVRVVGMATVWSVVYEVPSRYNWMLQFYMREQGIALSWVGTGRIIFNFAFEDEHFAEFCQRFIRAAQAMQNDGWWWTGQGQSNRTIRREVMREMVRIKWAV